MSGKRVLITGATGLLGRATVKAFEQSDFQVFGIGFSRVTEETTKLRKCDLRSELDTRKLFKEIKPDVVIHCAGIRPPNSEKDIILSEEINCKVTDQIAKICNDLGTWLLLISTNDVFDGREGPYAPSADAHPLNNHGKTKRDAELALWKHQKDGGILRVTNLYGNLVSLDECEISQIAKAVIDKKPVSLDNQRVLYPTFVEDVAQTLIQLADRKILHCGLYGTWHFAGKESFTAFTLAQEIAKLFAVDCSHISPSIEENGPRNAQLNCIALQVMSIGKISDFKETLKRTLEPFFVPQK